MPASREAILHDWKRTDRRRPRSMSATRPKSESVTGAAGDFTITLTNGDVIKAETIIMAIRHPGKSQPGAACDAAPGLPHVQYQLDDPREYFDEHSLRESARGRCRHRECQGLAEDPEQNNYRHHGQPLQGFLLRPRRANVEMLMEAQKSRAHLDSIRSLAIQDRGRLDHHRDGRKRKPVAVHRVIARMGSAAPRGFVESSGRHAGPADLDDKGRPKLKGGIQFSSAARGTHFPLLTPQFETTVPGVYAIGALAGYPLIKHCMNQGS